MGQLSHTEEIKGAIRDNGGILALMRCVNCSADGLPCLLRRCDELRRCSHVGRDESLHMSVSPTHGLRAIVEHVNVCRQLKADGASEGTLEVVTRAITMLTINNKANQDYIRYVTPKQSSACGFCGTNVALTFTRRHRTG